jgi:hypothetical protein
MITRPFVQQTNAQVVVLRTYVKFYEKLCSNFLHNIQESPISEIAERPSRRVWVWLWFPADAVKVAAGSHRSAGRSIVHCSGGSPSPANRPGSVHRILHVDGWTGHEKWSCGPNTGISDQTSEWTRVFYAPEKRIFKVWTGQANSLPSRFQAARTSMHGNVKGKTRETSSLTYTILERFTALLIITGQSRQCRHLLSVQAKPTVLKFLCLHTMYTCTIP